MLNKKAQKPKTKKQKKNLTIVFECNKEPINYDIAYWIT